MPDGSGRLFPSRLPSLKPARYSLSVTLAATSEETRSSHITESRAWWIVTWLAVAFGIFIRCWHLGGKSVWFDEGYTAWLVSHSPAEIIRLIRADTAPPLYYLLLHGWTILFGRSEVALRSLSTVFSILTLFVAIDIARRILANPAAIAAAVIAMSLSFMQLWYAQEARGYAMMAFLFIAAFDCLLCHLAARHRWWLGVLPILFAAAMYTHNMMAPYVAAVLLAWLVLPSEHSLWRRIGEIAAVITIAGLLYLPWAIWGLPDQMQMIRHGFWADPLDHNTFFSILFSQAGVKQYWSAADALDRFHIRIANGEGPIVIAAVLLGASAILSILFQRGPRRRQAIGLLLAALFPPLFVALYSILRTPLFIDKLFLPSATLLPIFAMIPLAMPLSRLPRILAWCGAGLLLFMTGVTLFGYHKEGFKEDWRSAAAVVSQMPPAHRLIIFIANDGQLPFDYYYHYRPGDEATGVPGGFFDLNPPRTMRRVESAGDLDPLKDRLDSGHYDQIVLLLAHQGWGDPKALAQELIGGRYHYAGRAEFYDVVMQWYTPP
jgi:4-amino-4-deoxy-L-arabinose transferase-like glycosyltransferase